MHQVLPPWARRTTSSWPHKEENLLQDAISDNHPSFNSGLTEWKIQTLQNITRNPKSLVSKLKTDAKVLPDLRKKIPRHSYKIYGILKYSPRILKLAASHEIQVGVGKWEKDWCEVRKEKLTSIVMFVGGCCQSALGRSRCCSTRSCRWCEDTREERGGSESVRHSFDRKSSFAIAPISGTHFLHILSSASSSGIPHSDEFILSSSTSQLSLSHPNTYQVRFFFSFFFFSFLSSNLIEIVASVLLKE